MNNIFKIPAFQRRKAIPKQLKDLELLPLNEQFSKLTMSIVGDDDLRPVMTGNFFAMESKKIVSTDAHKLTAINMPKDTFNFIAQKYNKELDKDPRGLIFHTLSQLQQDYNKLMKNNNITISFDEFINDRAIEDGRYPNYEAVIPKEFTNEIYVDYSKLYWYAKVLLDAKVIDDVTKINTSNANEYQNKKIEYLKDSYVPFLPYTKQIILTYTLDGKQEYIGFNARLLCDLLKFAMEFNGKTFGLVGLSGNSRAMVIELENGLNVINDSVGIVMPIFLQSGEFDNTIGDSDFNNNVAMYYDLDTNSIISDNKNYPIDTMVGFYPNKVDLSTSKIRVKEEVSKVENSSADLIDKRIKGLKLALQIAKDENRPIIEKSIRGLEIAKKMSKFGDGGGVGQDDIKKLNAYWESFYKGVMAGKKDKGYTTITNKEELNKYITSILGDKVKDIELFEKGISYPYNSSYPYREDIYFVTLKDGTTFKIIRSYGKPRWEGNVDYKEQIIVENIKKMADGGMVSYDINWEDENGDEYSESFDTIEEVNDLIKNIKKNGGRIIEKLKYIGDDFKGYFENGGAVDEKLSYKEFIETLRDNDKINAYTGKTTTGMEMFYLPTGHSYLGKKFTHKNKQKAYKEYLSTLMMANGGGVGMNKSYNNPENAIHVLHIDNQNWYLEKIDSTHFYMSNDPNFRGMAHHIGQHNGEIYYDEVKQWLKDTQYAKGGAIMSDGKFKLRGFPPIDKVELRGLYDDFKENFSSKIERFTKHLNKVHNSKLRLIDIKELMDYAKMNFVSKGGMVEYHDYKGVEIMYEPTYEEYFVNDMVFNTLEKAQKYIDSGEANETPTYIQNLYRRGAMANGGRVDDFKIWEILFLDKGVQKSILVEGYSSIIETNNWKKQNPNKEFIQIRLYGDRVNDYDNGGGVEKITQAEWLNQNFKEAVNHIIEIHKRVKLKSGNELLLLKKESGWGIAKYNPKTKKELEWYRYADKEIANYWIDKVDVDKYSDGGSVDDFSEYNFQVGDKLDLGSKGIKYFKQYDGEKIIVVDSKSDLKSSKGSYTYPSSVKKVLNKRYSTGGGVDNDEKYYIIFNESGSYNKKDSVLYRDDLSEKDAIRIANDLNKSHLSPTDENLYYVEKASDSRFNYGNINKRFLNSVTDTEQVEILENIANHYEITQNKAYAKVTDVESELLEEYITDISLRRKVYSDRINRRYATGGDIENEQVYIDYMNKEKGFKKDRIYFDSYAEAVEWGKKNFEKFNTDMINYV